MSPPFVEGGAGGSPAKKVWDDDAAADSVEAGTGKDTDTDTDKGIPGVKGKGSNRKAKITACVLLFVLAVAVASVVTALVVTAKDSDGDGEYDDSPYYTSYTAYYSSNTVTLDSILFRSAENCSLMLYAMGVYPGAGFGNNGNNPIMYEYAEPMQMMADAAVLASGKISGSSLPSAPPPSDVDFSGTNNQNEEADEGDIVKTDGSHVYVIGGRQLIIYDAATKQEVAHVNLTQAASDEEAACSASSPEFLKLKSFMAKEALLQGSSLVVVGTVKGLENVQSLDPEKFTDIRNKYRWFDATVVQTWDVSNPAAPALVSEHQVEGSMLTTRLVGTAAYVAVKSSMHMPYYELEGDSEYTYANYYSSFSSAVLPVMRSGGDAWGPVTSGCQAVGFVEGMDPTHLVTLLAVRVIGLNTGSVISSETVAQSVLSYGDSASIYASSNSVYLANQASPYSGKYYAATAIVAFDIADGVVSYRASGVVQGYLLNQFSLDEHNGHLRVATTIQSPRHSVVYVLDASTLAEVGRIAGLGPTEDIYSARFLGDMGYVVTFRQVDPLYVLDLSDPTAPAVTGELKITGYSSYLHPAGDSFLIGIGQEASTSGVIQGLKVSLFDVSNPADPQEVAKAVVGEGWGSSAVMADHKAFLYRPSDGLTVLPVDAGSYKGALVMTITGEAGIQLYAYLTHQESTDEYYYCSPLDIKRSLYIGNDLWSLSDRKLQTHQIDKLLQGEKSVSADLVPANASWTGQALEDDQERAELTLADGSNSYMLYNYGDVCQLFL